MKKISFSKAPLLLMMLMGLLMAGCVSQKKVTYMQGVDDVFSGGRTLPTTYDIRIQADDQLAISVAAQEKELLEPFTNKTMIGTSNGGGSSSKGGQYFTVDKSGVIDFPVFGQIKVAGYTRSELARLLEQRFKTGGYVTDPVVSVEIMSFRVSVLGEVGSPGPVTSSGERLSIFDALAVAGDIKPTGLRQKVLVLREQGGKLQSYRIDVSDARSVVNSPVYYLKQNDVIYVEPNGGSRVDGSPVYKYLSGMGSVLSALSSILTVILIAK